METVIVGVQPEASAQPALRWAMSYARATGAALVLVSAREPDQAEVTPEHHQAAEDRVREHAERELAAAEGASPPVSYDVVVQVGSPEHVLVHAAEQAQATLIVVGHPSGSEARWTSSVLAVANDGELPVVIAQGPAPELSDQPIIAAVDGARSDVAVLAWAADLAARAGSTVRPAIAVPAGAHSYPHPPGATTADRRVARLREELALAERDERIPADLTLTVLDGEPGEALATMATDQAATLIVTGRGRGPLLDKVPAALVDHGVVDIAIVPAQLPPAWHRAHGADALPGEPIATDRWQSVLGWVEEAMGWASADRRTEARGELRRLAAADPDAPSAVDPDDQEALLDEAELRVRRDHGDLARGTPLEDGPRKTPPEAG